MRRGFAFFMAVAVSSTLSLTATASVYGEREAWDMEGDYLFLATADTQKPVAKEKKYDPKESFEKFSKKLGLTPEQKEKVRPILNEKVEKVREIKKDKALSKEQRKEKAMKVIDEYYGKIRELLTPDQQQKFDKMREEKKEKYRKKKEESR